MATRGKTGRRNKAKTSWALRIVLIICAAFLFVKLVQLHVQIEEKQQQILLQNESINKYTLINEDLNEQIAHADENLERQANNAADLYLPGQQIYQSSAG